LASREDEESVSCVEQLLMSRKVPSPTTHLCSRAAETMENTLRRMERVASS
jgi:hypothetical protein